MAQELKSPKSGTVFVGCKLPHGLNIQLVKPREEKENVMGGGVRPFTINRRTGEKVKLHGVSLAPGERPNFVLTNGAAITKVSAAFWEQWLEQNKDSKIVKSGLVFAHDSEASTRAQAREMKSEKSGFEPINPATDSKGRAIDPRMRGVRSVSKKQEEEDEDQMEET